MTTRPKSRFLFPSFGLENLNRFCKDEQVVEPAFINFKGSLGERNVVSSNLIGPKRFYNRLRDGIKAGPDVRELLDSRTTDSIQDQSSFNRLESGGFIECGGGVSLFLCLCFMYFWL